MLYVFCRVCCVMLSQFVIFCMNFFYLPTLFYSHFIEMSIHVTLWPHILTIPSRAAFHSFSLSSLSFCSLVTKVESQKAPHPKKHITPSQLHKLKAIHTKYHLYLFSSLSKRLKLPQNDAANLQVMFGEKWSKIPNAANFLHLLNAIHITIQKRISKLTSYQP